MEEMKLFGGSKKPSEDKDMQRAKPEVVSSQQFSGYSLEELKVKISKPKAVLPGYPRSIHFPDGTEYNHGFLNDLLLGEVFKNINIAKGFVDALTGKDIDPTTIEVRSQDLQVAIKRLDEIKAGKNPITYSTIDIAIHMSDGKVIVEVQAYAQSTFTRRIRFYAKSDDSIENARSGKLGNKTSKDVKYDIPDLYLVSFISEKVSPDLTAGKHAYRFCRMIDQFGDVVDDGQFTIFINYDKLEHLKESGAPQALIDVACALKGRCSGTSYSETLFEEAEGVLNNKERRELMQVYLDKTQAMLAAVREEGRDDVFEALKKLIQCGSLPTSVLDDVRKLVAKEE